MRDHLIDQVIGDPVQGVRTRGALKDTCEYASYISQLEPKNFKKAENEKEAANKKAGLWPCKKN